MMPTPSETRWQAGGGVTGHQLTRGHGLRAGAAAGDSPCGQFGQSVRSTMQPRKSLQHNTFGWMRRDVIHCVATHPTPPKILEWGPLDSRDERRDFFLHTVENFRLQQTYCAATDFNMPDLSQKCCVSTVSTRNDGWKMREPTP
jgi:hypothetical protein